MSAAPRLGLRENAAQFSILVLVNGFVGVMVGVERAILPALAEAELHLAASSAILSFIVVFGLSKALTNYAAGRWAERLGRRRTLLLGWALAAPVPPLLMWAPTWGWIVAANALLGVSQGLTWSTTVIMKIDLAGPARRGLAMGLNELAGYLAVALTALATGLIAERFGLRPWPFALGAVAVVLGGGLSVLAVRDTAAHAAAEAASRPAGPDDGAALRPGQVFARTTWGDPTLSAVSQAGFVNNLNDGMAWGLFPVIFAAAGLPLSEVGALAAIYPGVWGLGQLATGALSDRVGRKPLIVGGMWVQAAGIVIVALGDGWAAFAAGATLLGLGTAMVYPTLLAAIGDVAHPRWRAEAVGTYRLWRDLGYAAGAALAGLLADRVGVSAAALAVAALTFASGLLAAARMRSPRPDTADRARHPPPRVPGGRAAAPSSEPSA